MKRWWLACVIVVACGDDSAFDAATDAGNADAVGDAERDTEPEGLDASEVDAAQDVGVDASLGDPGYLIHLDFGGERFRSLFGDEEAVPPFIMPSVVAGGERNLARDAFEVGWEVRRRTFQARIAEHVANVFAPFDVQVVTLRPEGRNHAHIIVGGNVADSGDSRGPCEILGHAPALCGSPREGTGIRRGFVHSACFRAFDLDTLAERLAGTSSHELGHLFSLMHSDGGGIMTSSSLLWSTGTVTGDDPLCRTGVQDSEAVLLSQLGRRVARVAPPPPADTEAPMLDAWPVEGTISNDVTPCVNVSDESPIEVVFVQVYALPIDAPDEFPWLFVTQQWQDGPEYSFEPLDLSGWRQVAIRFTATDATGNTREIRRQLTVDPDAAPASCPL